MRWVTAAVMAVMCATLLAAAPAGARVRHSPVRSVCVHRSHRVKTHGHATRIRVHTCVRLLKFIPIVTSRPAPSGTFAGIPSGPAHAPIGDDEPPRHIPAGSPAPFGRKPTVLSVSGLPVAGAHVAAGGVSIAGTFDLAAGPFTLDTLGNILAGSGIQVAEMTQSSETSVAYAPGNVVMYTSNGQFGSSSGFGTAYSTNGGITFHRLYATATAGSGATAIFPYPSYATSSGNGCLPLCDQIVTYDKYNNMFVWVLQYPQNNGATNLPNFERIAYASPQALVAHGSKAWSYTDLQSSAISSKVSLDQPRLGVTPKWVYISFNTPKATIVRIAHNAFKDLTYTHTPLGTLIPHATKIPAGAVQTINSSACPACSFRIARSTDGINPGGGYREYFAGIGTTASSVDLASVADNSSFLVYQNVPTWGMAIGNGASLTDWGSLVPNGKNWLNRTSNTIANPSVTESHGIVFVAWNEGRTVYNASGQPTDINNKVLPKGSTTYVQPHIGIAGFADNSTFPVSTGSIGTATLIVPDFTLYYSNEFLNPNYALAMPELATAADGEVAMGFYAGGGPTNTSASNSIYVAHGVGFLWGAHGDPVFKTDAKSDNITADLTNDYGDYNTIVPLPTNGNCLVSSAVVTQTPAQQNQPIMTLFSHPGHYCPTVRQPSGPLRITTHISLGCQASVTAGSVTLITGQLTPAPSGGTPITLGISGGPGGGTQTVTTSASGVFSAVFTPGAAGTYSVTASYGGTLIFAASSNGCNLTVKGLPSSLAMNCSRSAAPGDQVTETAQLSPALAGQNITWTTVAPDGTITTEVDPTDNTATSYLSLTVGQAGTWQFLATWAGDATHAGATGTCQFAVQSPTTIVPVMDCPTAPVHPLTLVSISAMLTPALPATPVSLTYSAPPGGTSHTDVVTTDGTGYFADSYGPDIGGTWTVTASFAGDATRAPSQYSCTFSALGS
jgi:hypothetical protein